MSRLVLKLNINTNLIFKNILTEHFFVAWVWHIGSIEFVTTFSQTRRRHAHHATSHAANLFTPLKSTELLSDPIAVHKQLHILYTMIGFERNCFELRMEKTNQLVEALRGATNSLENAFEYHLHDHITIGHFETFVRCITTFFQLLLTNLFLDLTSSVLL